MGFTFGGRGAFGYANVEVAAAHALWLVGLDLDGKVFQHNTEAKQAMAPKAPGSR